MLLHALLLCSLADPADRLKQALHLLDLGVTDSDGAILWNAAPSMRQSLPGGVEFRLWQATGAAGAPTRFRIEAGPIAASPASVAALIADIADMPSWNGDMMDKCVSLECPAAEASPCLEGDADEDRHTGTLAQCTRNQRGFVSARHTLFHQHWHALRGGALAGAMRMVRAAAGNSFGGAALDTAGMVEMTGSMLHVVEPMDGDGDGAPRSRVTAMREVDGGGFPLSMQARFQQRKIPDMFGQLAQIASSRSQVRRSTFDKQYNPAASDLVFVSPYRGAREHSVEL